MGASRSYNFATGIGVLSPYINALVTVCAVIISIRYQNISKMLCW